MPTATAEKSTTYTITLTNSGPSAVPPGVVVKDSIPANPTASTSDSRCTLAACFLTCTTTAALASTVSLHDALPISIAPDYPGTTLTNTATIDSSPVPDPNTANNTASDTDTVTKSADLGITKSDSPGTVIAGGTLTYTLTVSNAGPSTARTDTVSHP